MYQAGWVLSQLAVLLVRPPTLRPLVRHFLAKRRDLLGHALCSSCTPSRSLSVNEIVVLGFFSFGFFLFTPDVLGHISITSRKYLACLASTLISFIRSGSKHVWITSMTAIGLLTCFLALSSTCSGFCLTSFVFSRSMYYPR